MKLNRLIFLVPCCLLSATVYAETKIVDPQIGITVTNNTNWPLYLSSISYTAYALPVSMSPTTATAWGAPVNLTLSGPAVDQKSNFDIYSATFDFAQTTPTGNEGCRFTVTCHGEEYSWPQNSNTQTYYCTDIVPQATPLADGYVCKYSAPINGTATNPKGQVSFTINYVGSSSKK